jgi:hypothetical protein
LFDFYFRKANGLPHIHQPTLAAITERDMKLIPFEIFTIETTLTKDQVKERLKKRIGKNKANNFERTDQNLFFGTLKDDKFEIHPILDNKSNSWKPFLFGNINESRSGTIVRVIMRPNAVVLMMTAIFALTGYLTTDMVLKIESKDLEIGLSFMSPLIAYVICTAAFHSDTDMCKDHLVEITKGELK